MNFNKKTIKNLVGIHWMNFFKNLPNKIKWIKEMFRIYSLKTIKNIFYLSLKNIKLQSRWFRSKNIKTLLDLTLIFKEVGIPDVFIDCKPGIMNSEAWWVDKNWKSCKIIGLEPSFIRYQQMKHNYPGILLNMGVSNENERIQGFIDNKFYQFVAEKNTIEQNVRYRKSQVKMRTIDYIVNKYGPFEKIFIWADIEGYELKLLEGAKNSLREGLILGFNLELWPRKAKSIFDEFIGNRCTADEIIEYLGKYSFKIYGKKAKELLISDPNFESIEWFQDFFFIQGNNKELIS